MKMKAILAGGVLALGLGTAAQAATCEINDVTFSLTVSSAPTGSCVAGNDLGNGGIVDANLTFFGLNNWVIGDSSDGSASQSGKVEFQIMPGVGTSSGTWSIKGYNGYDPLMIVLKSGTQYGAFLISELISGTSGDWFITEEKCDKQNPLDCKTDPKNLSHVSVYHQPAPIPLPAAGFLLLGALGGLAALRRKKA